MPALPPATGPRCRRRSERGCGLTAETALGGWEIRPVRPVSRPSLAPNFVHCGPIRSGDIRAFTPAMREAAYERQAGICPRCGEHFALGTMEADHIDPCRRAARRPPRTARCCAGRATAERGQNSTMCLTDTLWNVQAMNRFGEAPASKTRRRAARRSLVTARFAAAHCLFPPMTPRRPALIDLGRFYGPYLSRSVCEPPGNSLRAPASKGQRLWLRPTATGSSGPLKLPRQGGFPGGRRREGGLLRPSAAKKRPGAWDSRHSNPFFPLSRDDPAGSSPTAGNADRAVLIDFT